MNDTVSRRAFIALLPALPLAGCQAMLVGQFQAAPIENRLFLHPGYRVGDYARYEAMDGAMHVLLRIVAIDAGRVEVELSWPKQPLHLGFMAGLRRRMWLDADGRVLAAHVEDSGGRRHPLRVAAPGDPNHLGDAAEVGFGPAQALATPAGVFDVRKVLVFTLDLDNGVLKQRVTSAIFLVPGARFGFVRRLDIYATRLPALELYNRALAFASLPEGARRLYELMLSRIGSEARWEMTLLESG